jgi:hypothetical protein
MTSHDQEILQPFRAYNLARIGALYVDKYGGKAGGEGEGDSTRCSGCFDGFELPNDVCVHQGMPAIFAILYRYAGFFLHQCQASNGAACAVDF